MVAGCWALVQKSWILITSVARNAIAQLEADHAGHRIATVEVTVTGTPGLHASRRLSRSSYHRNNLLRMSG
jgi:hypothetical protein